MLVSIAVITYNHEKYIQKALESILIQEVTFEYEIVIGDDCSKDNTRKIIEDYQKKYPQIIRVLERKQNLGATKNFYDVLLNCRGAYIALLEGDDYWTDKHKLQLQIDYMEHHPQCYGVTHKYKKKTKDNRLIEDKQKSGIYTERDFSIGTLPGQTATICFRNFLHDGKDSYDIIAKASDMVGDRTIILLILLHGYIYCIDRFMSIYRLNSTETAWTALDSQYNLCENYMKYYCALTDYAKYVWKKRQSLFGPKSKCFFNAYLRYKSDKTKQNKYILQKVYKLYDENKFVLYLYFGASVIKYLIVKPKN